MHHEIDLQRRWIRHRDANAFAELVHQHAGMVFATCRRILNDATEAEDVAQECFMELAGAHQVVTPSLGGWLHRVAVFRSLNRIRGTKRRQAREAHYAITHPAITHPDWNDIKPHLDEAIASLPEKFRRAVVQRFLAGETQEEVAIALGVSRSTAQYRIDKGVEKIRKFLRARGVTAAATVLVAAMEANAQEAAPGTLVASLGERAIAAYPHAASSVGMGAVIWKAAVGLALVLGTAVAINVMGTRVPGSGYVPQSAQEAEVGESAGENPDDTEEVRLPTAQVVATPAENLSATFLPVSNTSNRAPTEISGRVYTEATFVPLAGFTVMAYPKGTPMDGESKPAAESKTDDNGHYSLQGLSVGRYTIHAVDSALSYNVMEKTRRDSSRAPRRGGQVEMMVATVKSAATDIVVDAEGCLVGYVTYADGTPAVSVRVWARGESTNLKYWAERETDGTGRFVFIGLESDHALFLQASSDSHTSGVEGPYRLSAGDKDPPTLVLGEAASVEGTIVDSKGRPAPHAMVWMRTDADYVVHPRFLLADEAGDFTASGLESATYDLLLAPVGSQRIDEGANVTHFHWGTINRVYRDEAPALKLTLRPGETRTGLRIGPGGAEIAGRVVDIAGQPIPGVSVQIMDRGRDKTAKDGHFRLSGLPADRYVVFASHEDYRSQRLDDVPAGSSDLDVVMERRGVVAGQVVDGRTGKPISEFELYTGADRPYETWMDRWFKAHTDPEGRFSYKPNFATERVFARAPGYAVGSAHVAETHLEDPPTRVTIALEEGRVVNGIVVDSSGAPVQGASIFRDTIPSESTDREASVLARTGSDGRFSVDSLPKEPVTLIASHKELGYASASTASESGPENAVRLVLSGMGGVAMQVSGETGGLEGVSVRATVVPEASYGTAAARPSAVETGVTDSTGRYQFTNLPIGRAQLTCMHEGRSRIIVVDVEKEIMPTYEVRFLPLTVSMEGNILATDGALVDQGSLTLSVKSLFGVEHFHTEWIDGYYQFDGLPPGSAELQLQVGDAIPNRFLQTVELESNTAIELDINLADTLPIGHVVEEAQTVGIRVPLIEEIR